MSTLIELNRVCREVEIRKMESRAIDIVIRQHAT